MASIDLLLPLVAPHAPSAPRPTYRHALRMASIEFCERTKCWRDVISATITPGPSHEVFDPNFGVIHQIEAAWLNDVELEPRYFSDFSPSELASPPRAVPPAAQIVAQPRYFTQVDATSVSLVPNVGGRLTMNVILKPPAHGGRFDEETPPIFLYQYAQAVSYGALDRLLRLPGQPWTNVPEADKNALRFERAITGNLNTHFRGQHRARPRVRSSYL